MQTLLRRSMAALALVAFALTAGGWFSLHSTGRLLDRQAAAELAAYAGGGSPFAWRFDSAADLAGNPIGLSRVEFSPEGLRARLTGNDADLSLNLRGRSIDADVLKRFKLVLHTDAPVELSLFFSETLQPSAPAFRSIDFPLAAGAQRLDIALDDFPWAGSAQKVSRDNERRHAAVLRLHIRGNAGTAVGITSAVLRIDAPVPGAACQGSEEIAETLQRCPGPVRWLRAPDFATPEQTLHWRARIWAAAPASIVSAGNLDRDGKGAGSSHADALIAALMALSFLLAGRYGMSLGHSPRGRAALELSALLAPALWLIGSGWPGDDTPWPVATAFAALLLLAAALSKAPALSHWQGQRAAWAATAMATVAALVVLMAVQGLAADGSAIAAPGPETPARSFQWNRLPRYALFALVQQSILIGVLLERCRILTGRPVFASLLSAALFAALHLPNFGLFCATFAAGAVWARIALRYNCLLPQMISHLVLGSVLLPLTPVWLLRSAEIGGRFLSM